MNTVQLKYHLLQPKINNKLDSNDVVHSNMSQINSAANNLKIQNI